MSIFKRGKVYWFHFIADGKHIQRSTKQGNPRVARQIEVAFRTALAKSDVGISERKKLPGSKSLCRRFWIGLSGNTLAILPPSGATASAVWHSYATLETYPLIELQRRM